MKVPFKTLNVPKGTFMTPPPHHKPPHNVRKGAFMTLNVLKAPFMTLAAALRSALR